MSFSESGKKTSSKISSLTYLLPKHEVSGNGKVVVCILSACSLLVSLHQPFLLLGYGHVAVVKFYGIIGFP